MKMLAKKGVRILPQDSHFKKSSYSKFTTDGVATILKFSLIVESQCNHLTAPISLLYVSASFFAEVRPTMSFMMNFDNAGQNERSYVLKCWGSVLFLEAKQ